MGLGLGLGSGLGLGLGFGFGLWLEQRVAPHLHAELLHRHDRPLGLLRRLSPPRRRLGLHSAFTLPALGLHAHHLVLSGGEIAICGGEIDPRGLVRHEGARASRPPAQPPREPRRPHPEERGL